MCWRNPTHLHYSLVASSFRPSSLLSAAWSSHFWPPKPPILTVTPLKRNWPVMKPMENWDRFKTVSAGARGDGSRRLGSYTPSCSSAEWSTFQILFTCLHHNNVQRCRHCTRTRWAGQLWWSITWKMASRFEEVIMKHLTETAIVFTLAIRQLPPGGVSGRATSLGCGCRKNRKCNHRAGVIACCQPRLQPRHSTRGGAKTLKTDACGVSRMPERTAWGAREVVPHGSFFPRGAFSLRGGKSTAGERHVILLPPTLIHLSDSKQVLTSRSPLVLPFLLLLFSPFGHFPLSYWKVEARGGVPTFLRFARTALLLLLEVFLFIYNPAERLSAASIEPRIAQNLNVAIIKPPKIHACIL